MRVGLVLGAGGVLGASWLIGALEALESETGWQPARADVIVGTSAGSVIGALTAAGIPPAYMGAYSSGRSLEELEPLEGLELDEDVHARRDSGVEFGLHRGLPGVGPGSWRMALGTLRHPLRHPASALMCGWLPRGVVSTGSITGLVDRFIPVPWPDHPNLWIMACDYGSGRRVAFGRDGSPPATVRDAVAASCAIPGFYHPVTIGGRRYVDGGVCSVSNADLLCDEELDVAVILNPMSSLAEVRPRNAGERLAAAMRGVAGRRLGHELRKLRAQGTEVLVLQPTADDLAVMGANLMSRRRRAEVMEQAVVSTALQLRAGRGDLPRLPRRRAATGTAAQPGRAARRRAA